MGLLSSAFKIGASLLGARSSRKRAKRAEQQMAESGRLSLQDAMRIGRQAAGMARFRGFGIRSGLGSAGVGRTGSMTLRLSPEQQRMQDMLFSQARGLFARAAEDPAVAQAELFEQMRDIQRPEEERARLALEERALSQGRLGLGLDRFGGSTPEMLAQATAEQEAMGRANLAARQQALAEQEALYGRASGLFGLGYVPMQQLMGQTELGLSGGELATEAKIRRAGLFAQAAGLGVDPKLRAQTAQEAAGMRSARRGRQTQMALDLAGGLFGRYGGIGSAPVTPDLGLF